MNLKEMFFKINKTKDSLDTMKGMLLRLGEDGVEKFDNVYLGENLVLIVRQDYAKLLEQMDEISELFGVTFKYDMAWSVGGDDMIFSWNTPDMPLQFWYSSVVSKVPEQLLNGCHIETVTQETTDNRLVCDGKGI